MAPAIASAIESVPAPAGPPEPVHVLWYTDPINVWCWGCEPAIRRVQARYPDDVRVELVMGGLFEDFGPIIEYWSRMSGGRWQDSVRAFLNSVAAHHRMPMDVPRLMTSVEELKSTWPSCIAVKAAGLQGEAFEYPYLRRFREAMYIEGRTTTRREAQAELAREIGLDASAFERALDDGSAEAAFHRDLDLCRSKGVTGFPTFELVRGSASARLDGWQPWDAFEEALREFAPDLRPRPIDTTPASVLGLIRRYDRCATLEVAAILGVTDDEAELTLEELEARGTIVRREVGAGLFWEPPQTATARVPTQREDASGE
jgi:protein-disulfide isomerase-like protein with CxxC motif